MANDKVRQGNDKEKALLDNLVARRFISEATATTILSESSSSGKNIEDIILEKNLLAVEDFIKAKAEFFGFPYIDLMDRVVEEETLNLVPPNIAEHYKIVAFEKEGNRIKVGLVDSENVKAKEAMQFLAQRGKFVIDYYLISLASFNTVFKQYKDISKEVSSALALKAKKDEKDREEVKKLEDTSTVEGVVQDAPVAKIVSVIIRHAIEGGASDIHIEPLPKECRVRYRIDGILHTSLVLPKDVHSSVIARIKVLSDLKLDETRIPQDGRIRLRINERDVDFRVSSMPLLDNEKVVMRVLDTARGVTDLEKLGFAGLSLKTLKSNLDKTGGIMLVTGPTGSGKSTTLYSLLHILNQESRNIITLEDPVEYFVKGVNQSQVHPEVNFTFSSGLRSILRQDPDIIMVGEIRDNETAELAIHAALTGHLVLSTLHTRDAIGTIGRLLDMKIEPFLLAQVLNLCLAQRLARCICTYCKKETKLEEGFFAQIKAKIAEIPEAAIKAIIPDFDPTKVVFYTGEGCSHCGKTGYRSRVSISESIDVNNEMKELILKNKGSISVDDVRENQSFITMEQDGLIKSIQGITTLEEVMRVIQN